MRWYLPSNCAFLFEKPAFRAFVDHFGWDRVGHYDHCVNVEKFLNQNVGSFHAGGYFSDSLTTGPNMVVDSDVFPSFHFDHTHLFKGELDNGHLIRVMTTQPYTSFDAYEQKTLNDWCDKNKVTYVCYDDDKSWWFPGSTKLFIFASQETRKLLWDKLQSWGKIEHAYPERVDT